MNKEGGFIKVYRSMLKWEWHDDPITVATWVYCLARANYTTQKWHGEIIKPGQFVTSLAHMAKDIGITKGQLRVALNHLKSTQNIAQCATQHATLITIEKWSEYQSAGEKATQLATQQTTSRQHLDNISTATIEEDKEDKERKEKENIEKGEGAFVGAMINNDEEVLSPEESSKLISNNHQIFTSIKQTLMRQGI